MDTLSRIKRLVIARHIEFTAKAELERIADGLTVEDVVESIVRATAIKKTIRSLSPRRRRRRERLYVIESPNYSGCWIYTKGTIRSTPVGEKFYVFISCKVSD